MTGEVVFRVGDYVYVETSTEAPYQIRKIESFDKTHSGTIDARVTCFFRRRDLSSRLLNALDRANKTVGHIGKCAVKSEGNDEGGKANGSDMTLHVLFRISEFPNGFADLGPDEQHLLRQRELFGSTQTEVLPVVKFRGKCTVTALSEVDTVQCYLNKDDLFFYSMVYDPGANTVRSSSDCSIRVGKMYQCEVPKFMDNDVAARIGEGSGKLMKAKKGIVEVVEPDRDLLIYHPNHNLSNGDIDQYLQLARSLGAMWRVHEPSITLPLSSLQSAVETSGRDITTFRAFDCLHKADYDVHQATKNLVTPESPQNGALGSAAGASDSGTWFGAPVQCRDQMEEWSVAEANIFQVGIEKYEKDFSKIREEFLPWRSLHQIVEFYYAWKTSSYYSEVLRSKGAKKSEILKQIYIPTNGKPTGNLISPGSVNGLSAEGTFHCQSCQAEECPSWYRWGPEHLHLRLCFTCWSLWKRNGGLARIHEYEGFDLRRGICGHTRSAGNGKEEGS